MEHYPEAIAWDSPDRKRIYGNLTDGQVTTAENLFVDPLFIVNAAFDGESIGNAYLSAEQYL